MKKIISFLLLLAMIALTLASCGGKPGTGTDEVTTAGEETPETTAATESDVTTEAQTTVAATTTDKWEVLGGEVADLFEFQRTFKIELSNHSDAEKSSKNDRFVVGPDSIDSFTPALDQFVYERNKAAVEMMGLNISYVYWDYEWSKQAEQIKTVVQGQAKDAPDLFVNMIADLTMATVSGTFKDTWSLPKSYFDFTTEGWMEEYMESLSLTGDRSYVLVGDYFLDVLRALSVLPVNIDMMDANAEKLAPYILASGQTLEAGEKLSDYFFDFVDDGKWTYSVLHELCEAIWVDTDGDGADSIVDVLGIVADNHGGMNSEMFIFTTCRNLFDVDVIEDENDPDYGRLKITYAQDMGELGDLFDAVATVFLGKGSVGTKANYSGSSPDNPGAAYHRIKFKEGTLLTAGVTMLGVLEDEPFQEMEQVFTVVPVPKLTEDRDYITLIHTSGDAGAINVNSKKALGISAFVQYCCEHSSHIREEFLEIVSKYKTTKYNQGTDRMLDLVYSTVVNGFEKMIEDCVGTKDRFFWIMMSGNSEVTSAALADRYQSAISAKQAILDKLVKTWYTLPKVEKTAE